MRTLLQQLKNAVKNNGSCFSVEMADRHKKRERKSWANECRDTQNTLYDEKYGPEFFERHYGRKPFHGMIQESIPDEHDDLVVWVKFYDDDDMLFPVIITEAMV